jgi:hypothetical protein
MRDSPGSGLMKTLMMAYLLWCLHLMVLRKQVEPRLGEQAVSGPQENALSVIYDVI